MLTGIKALVPQSLSNYYHLLQAQMASFLFSYPQKKMKIIGVTGTDGKTTTINLLYHILKSAGYKVGVISTVRIIVGERQFDTGLHVTTPSPIGVKKILRNMAQEGSQFALIEATSHALDQNRVADINFDIGLVTNITHEHLDYHKTFARYVRAKTLLVRKSQIAVLNYDDPSFTTLAEAANKTISYGLKKKADLMAKDIQLAPFGTHFTLNPGNILIRTSLLGSFNVYNCLAAIAGAQALGIETDTIVKALKTFPGLVGRLERIEMGQNFTVVVDFAHTPSAVSEALKALKPLTRNKLIAVFGSAGGRDSEKRPLMGERAMKEADLIVLTSDDPRMEDPNEIMTQIARGIVKNGGVLNKNFWMIKDRKRAIEFAVNNLAQTGDVLALLGKGHEKSMSIRGVEEPWSDQDVVRQTLKNRHQELINANKRRKKQ